jgi:L,D-peptidoglycan transpeptidase YkuD (ErfK/YbiS/YcfS/YnhG family)
VLPHAVSHEEMKREDRLYDRLMILDWNITRRVQGRGSAIFLHQARQIAGRLQGTQGCIALPEPILRRLAGRLARLKVIRVL